MKFKEFCKRFDGDLDGEYCVIKDIEQKKCIGSLGIPYTDGTCVYKKSDFKNEDEIQQAYDIAEGRTDLVFSNDRWKKVVEGRKNELSYAFFMDVDLSGINLSKADLSASNLSGADLRGANLSQADLHYATLTVADLSGANLSKANLTGASLDATRLRGANLIEADLTRTNVKEADFSRALLRDADFTDAKGVDTAIFNGADCIPDEIKRIIERR